MSIKLVSFLYSTCASDTVFIVGSTSFALKTIDSSQFVNNQHFDCFDILD